MNVHIQFKKGVLELCVLVLISRQDRYGYELVQVVPGPNPEQLVAYMKREKA